MQWLFNNTYGGKHRELYWPLSWYIMLGAESPRKTEITSSALVWLMKESRGEIAIPKWKGTECWSTNNHNNTTSKTKLLTSWCAAILSFYQKRLPPKKRNKLLEDSYFRQSHRKILRRRKSGWKEGRFQYFFVCDKQKALTFAHETRPWI